MLFQFSLYGFLKNQRYFEPFLILAFLDRGLSYTDIGFLIGFREVCINLLEVPTGAIADVVGRRKSMIFSFASYIGAFALFGISVHLWFLFVAMFFFSMGEAFRTGTHKAMIFDWLSHEGRAGEKTGVYGFTRSWSKIGSAVSVVIATAFVFVLQDYQLIFFLSIIPYVINIVNFLYYPAYLDGPMQSDHSVKQIMIHLFDGLKSAFRNRLVRRLCVESMGFEGTYKVTEDYLQPVIKSFALAVPLFLGMASVQRTALLVGLVYFVLYLLSSVASRHASWFEMHAGSEKNAAKRLWLLYLVVFLGMTVGFFFGNGIVSVAVTGFVILALLQNFWRPMLISRFATAAPADQMATMLSVESQGKSLFAALLAPIMGMAVDSMSASLQFLPVGVLGVLVSAGLLLVCYRGEMCKSE